MRDAVELKIALGRGEVVENEDGTSPPGKEMFQRQDLPPVTQRVLSQQPHLGQAVEYHSERLNFIDLLKYQFGCFTELQLRRMKQGQLAVRIETGFRRNKLEYGELVERPAVSLGHKAEFALSFRECDVEALFSSPCAFQKILKCNGRFAGAGFALNQIQPVRV